MNNYNSVSLLLTRLDNLMKQRGITRRQLSMQLRIPYGTLKKWFLKKNPKTPSPENFRRLRKYIDSCESEDAEPKRVWEQVREWWKTQHRYESVLGFATEIGWDPSMLRDCLDKNIAPPRVVLEKVASLLSMPFGTSAFQLDLAERKMERIRCLLLLLEEELKWFRDGSKEAREVFRMQLDAMDVGYLSSLLVMLGEEGAFRRWLTLTTNRFNYFRLKGNKNVSSNPDSA